MKIRNGFVSNSSSSSFIIGLAAISAAELEEAKKLGFTNDPDDDRVVMPITELLESIEGWRWVPVKSNGGWLSVESFDYTSVSINTDKAKELGYVAWMYETGDDPDGDGYDQDYDCDLDTHFTTKQQDAYYFLSKHGRADFGAGFNG